MQGSGKYLFLFLVWWYITFLEFGVYCIVCGYWCVGVGIIIHIHIGSDADVTAKIMKISSLLFTSCYAW